MGLLNNQKSQKTGCWSWHSKSRCIIYSTSLFTKKHNNPHRFGAVGGRKSNTLYQLRDLQSLQSLENRRIQLCRENKPKGSRVQRAAGPKRGPFGFDRGVVSKRKLYHRAEGAQRVGLFSSKSGIFFNSRGALPVCLNTNMRRNNPRTLLTGIMLFSSFWNNTHLRLRAFFVSTFQVLAEKLRHHWWWRKHPEKQWVYLHWPKVK